MENFASARFLLPIMVVFIVVILIPFLQSLVFSFTDYSGYNFADAKFVGFANYVQCFKDPTLLAGLGFTLLYGGHHRAHHRDRPAAGCGAQPQVLRP